MANQYGIKRRKREMWHYFFEAVLLAILFYFMLDCLTLLWVRRCYDLAYGLMVRTRGHLIFIDVDDFRQFNTKYGHQTGDRVLRKVGKIIMRESCLRGFRYGGDEFAVLLPWTSEEKALNLAEKLRMAVERANVDGLEVTLTCVVGHYEQEVTEFLRYGKASGKNQVVTCSNQKAGIK